MDKILLIVDPQVDFISGSLAVEGAKEKMDALASALQNGEIDCDYVMVTKDFHPSNHCSFKENGGQWPPHCVKGTTGSCIYAPLWSVICNYAYRKDTDIFIKGDSPDKEEYSIFDNLESLSVISDILLDFESDPDNEIRVVGIAGDYCVHETICDLIAMGYKDNIVKVFNLSSSYKSVLFDLCADTGLIKDCKGYDWYWVSDLEELAGRTPIANGNIQARCRMIHLYDIASIRKGLVMSTDNQTEYQLGFWTIHGDVGDFDPIQDLWKTEVYGLANYLQDHYKSKALEALRNDYKETCDNYKAMSCAIYNSCKLVPTDGLGISNSDLDQIGAKDYATVDDILSRFIPFENFRKSYDSAGQIMHPHDEMAESDCWSQLCARHGEDVVDKVWGRHLASEFKRKKAPIYIAREKYEND